MAIIDKIITIKLDNPKYDERDALRDAIYRAIDSQLPFCRWMLDGLPMDEIKKIIAKGVDINYPNPYTPLALAARFGIIDLAMELIHNGADINAKSKCGKTALMLANTIGVREYLKKQTKKARLKDLKS